MKKIVYDFGANNGVNIPYFLLKADLVVAVEANPDLCSKIISTFQSAITEGRLVVENCVLTDTESDQEVPFYIHKTNSVESQFPEPDKARISEFSKVMMRAVTPIGLIKKHGIPFYAKIDLECFDGVVLKHLFEHNIFPEYISAESHGPDIFALLIAAGGYDAFKLVDGRSIPIVYKETPIQTIDGSTQTHSFQMHSAGPFGEDVKGEWLSGKAMLRKLGLHGCGWRDLHAKRGITGTSNFSLKKEVLGKGVARLKKIIREPLD